MVLSHCLAALRNELQLELSAIHIDYNLRPVSALEAEFVKAWADRAKVPLAMVRLNVSVSEDRKSYEQRSRGARYRAYHEAMSKGAVAVLTGHHRDDAAENVLTNLLTGRSLFHIPVLGPEALIEGVTSKKDESTEATFWRSS